MELYKKLELLWGQPIFFTPDGTSPIQSFQSFQVEKSPLHACPALADMLIEKSAAQQTPVIYRDGQQLYFVCIHGPSGYFLFGPVCTGKLSLVEVHRFYKTYQIDTEEEPHPLQASLMRLLTFISFFHELLHGVHLEARALLEDNGLAKMDYAVPEQSMFPEQEDEFYHHTYLEERHVMESIREGNPDEVARRMDILMQSAGVLSKKKFNHYRNLAIVSVTVSTREAVEGGVPPAEAYQLSDKLINQIDECTNISQLVEFPRKSGYLFAQLVSHKKQEKSAGNYIELCRQYIDKHYHHKILLEDMAAAIGISPSHLSRCFHKETGLSIQEYIQQFRVERAANLLKYSEASLSQISDYVCFHSQSHFGSVFKRYMNMTPKQYRDKFKQNEFISKTGMK